MSNEDDQRRSGRCLCGAVRFSARGAPVIVAHCHCEDCQRLTGAGHSTGAMFAVDRFAIEGPVAEFRLNSNAGNIVTRVFCPACGSPVLGRNTGMDGFVTVSLGLFDDSTSFQPEVSIFTRNCRPWDSVDPSTQAFETQPGWRPAPLDVEH